jgi:hypothetical protein
VENLKYSKKYLKLIAQPMRILKVGILMIKLCLDNIFIEILYKSLGDQMGILNLVSEIDFSGLAKNQVGEGAHLVQPISVIEGQ